MRGIVLAAGPGRRLRPLTDALPKTLLSIADGTTILDVALSNLRAAGVEDVVVVTGFAAERVEERASALEERHGVALELVRNDRAVEWNNAYSLWLARESMRDGALIVNGDAVHPSSVEDDLLAARGPDLLLALDAAKELGDEEMKVVLADDGSIVEIAKGIDPRAAAGEYIGVALVEATGAAQLGDVLETTWRRDPSLYYEDSFQELARTGANVRAAPIRPVEWVEVDDPLDLARAQEIACRF